MIKTITISSKQLKRLIKEAIQRSLDDEDLSDAGSELYNPDWLNPADDNSDEFSKYLNPSYRSFDDYMATLEDAKDYIEQLKADTGKHDPKKPMDPRVRKTLIKLGADLKSLEQYR